MSAKKSSIKTKPLENVSRETLPKSQYKTGFVMNAEAVKIEEESRNAINASADINGDGRAQFGELYQSFRNNGLGRVDSLYNALFIVAQNNVAYDRRVKQRYKFLFRHPGGWFRKDNEHLIARGLWHFIFGLLLKIPMFVLSLSLLPSKFRSFFTRASEGFDSAVYSGNAFGVTIKKFGSALLVLAFAIFTCSYIKYDNSAVAAYEFYIDGERLGYVKSSEIYFSGLELAEESLSNKLGIKYKVPDDGSIKYKVAMVHSPEYVSELEIERAIIDSTSEKYLATGYGIYIDETLVAVSGSRMIADRIITDTLEFYNELYSGSKNANQRLSFSNSVTVAEATVPKSMIKSEDEIRKRLGLGAISEVSDLLLRDKSLDNLQLLDNGLPVIETITTDDIISNLPEDTVYYKESITDDATQGAGTGIEANDAVNEEDEVTTLALKTTATRTFNEIMPCEVEYVFDDTILEGRKIIEIAGVDGIKRATYEISYVNDEEISRELKEEVVIRAPKTKKVKVGTRKATDEDIATSPTGTFITPCEGSITSTFSGRTLFGRYEFHGALDISNNVGTPIYATDGGKVVYVGWNGTYGKCIIIDHGDGMESLYAHLNSYDVEVGEKVGQGWKIANMGVTGRVTGPHLHFEIRINGVRQDPQDYLE